MMKMVFVVLKIAAMRQERVRGMNREGLGGGEGFAWRELAGVATQPGGVTSPLLSHAPSRPHVPVVGSDPVVVAASLFLDYCVTLALETSEHHSGV